MTLLATRANSMLDNIRHETVELTDVSTLIVPCNPQRRFLMIQNDSNVVAYLNHKSDAELHKGIRLEANGGKLECSHANANLCEHEVYAIHGNHGQTIKLLITEGW